MNVPLEKLFEIIGDLTVKTRLLAAENEALKAALKQKEAYDRANGLETRTQGQREGVPVA